MFLRSALRIIFPVYAASPLPRSFHAGQSRAEIAGFESSLTADYCCYMPITPTTEYVRPLRTGLSNVRHLSEGDRWSILELVRGERFAEGSDVPGDSITPENVSLAFLRACRSVNISDFRFHDLRHTAASWMRMQGADIHTVALILGSQGFENGSTVSAPQPGLSVGCREALRHHVCGILADA